MRSLIRRRYSKWLVKISTIVVKKELKLNITSSRLGQKIKTLAIRYFRNEKGTGAEISPAIVSGIVTGDASVSYWPIFTLYLVTVPELFAKVNSAEFLLVSKVAHFVLKCLSLT